MGRNEEQFGHIELYMQKKKWTRRDLIFKER